MNRITETHWLTQKGAASFRRRTFFHTALLTQGSRSFYDSIILLGFEGRAFGLLASACAGTGHLDLLCMAFTGLIMGTGRGIAGDLRRFAGDIVRIAHTVRPSLPEAFTAGLIGHFRIVSAHMDIVLTAGIFLIVSTVDNRTV